MTRITGIRMLEGSIHRSGDGGTGDNWHTTWANDDKQYVLLADGSGWPEAVGNTGKTYNTRVFAINGDPPNHTFEHLPGYPDMDHSKHTMYGFGILALDGNIYHFLTTADHNPNDDPPLYVSRFIGAKLVYSPDNGESWKNQDGTPLRWGTWDERDRDNLVFHYEPGDAFSLLTMLQMGKNYEHNTDGYVYVYSPNGNLEGAMNQLVMFRVRKDRILDRAAYEYFVSRDHDGAASWSSDVHAKGVVHTFPSGWVNRGFHHPYAWHPSVVYNAPLGLYMMVNWGMGCNSEGRWFEKPSYLGFWVAEHPWGPWSQVYEDAAWAPEGGSAARCYQPQIIPKWISKDGKSFWLAFTDYQVVGGKLPYTCFNIQKAEILTE